MANLKSLLRVAVVQFNPKIGQVQANIARVRELCGKLEPQSVDLVCLPEMAFTGYVFDGPTSIKPYLERPHTGPTSRFCAELALRLRCYVVAGFPELLLPEELAKLGKDAGDKVGANAAVIYDPEGERVGDYRKTNLFETDQSWSIPGTGFATFTLPLPLCRSSLPPPLGRLNVPPPFRLTLGICMDLNAQPPALWSVAEGPYEIAEHARREGSGLLVLLNNWLDSGEELEEDKDWRTMNFWAARLRPLWQKEDGSDSVGEESEGEGKRTIVVICNRTGEENGKTFAGSSCLFDMRRSSGKPRLVDALNRTEEGVRVWNIPIDD
ncbi:carbon-nitrogen hydrolase [Schizophyllum commune H4-8]|uniref:CN hydrolase domain-containing protein n=1 Tax=Schizophyllum commune (strain H4-8 / FGSC 9210) TaxID=578458 RepID=D8PY17_SCHCM|nr:carbon-nitrogen hydrolase [Schizophyllum commune H4-8]KAI5897135.1 carbon-nitrogen hydrolase [Schizophyllum commune H4-8]